MTIEDFVSKQSIFAETRCTFRIQELDGTQTSLTKDNWNDLKEFEIVDWELEDFASGYCITFCI